MSQERLFEAAIEIQVYAVLLLKFFNDALEIRLRQHGSGINSFQYGILRMLMMEKLTISIISQRYGMDPSTLVRAVDALERKELVKRGSDPKDRRRNPISITEKGRELFLAVPVVSFDDLPFQALQSLGLDSAGQLRDLLRELLKKFPEGKMIVELMSGPPSDRQGKKDKNDKEPEKDDENDDKTS